MVSPPAILIVALWLAVTTAVFAACNATWEEAVNVPDTPGSSVIWLLARAVKPEDARWRDGALAVEGLQPLPLARLAQAGRPRLPLLARLAATPCATPASASSAQ